ncbi:MAG: retropepsin-like domain-containing protein [Deltaproteobacteria bacterium]|nr:retropepsin-like domain-containing protein [Deltaproteobacteria bacterium]
MPCVHHAIAQPAICEVCARDVAGRRRRGTLLVVAAVGLLPIAGGVVYLQTRPKPPPPPPVEADNVLRLQAEALAQHPCDEKMMRERVERFATLNRTAEALATAERAVGCGIGGRMPWRLAYLSQQLHQWLVTAVTTTQLIAEQPEDSDFWWWRADAWIDGKLPRLALFDLRQSLANSDGEQAGGFAAVRFLDAAKPTNELCEADRAWRYYVHALGGSPNADMRDEHAALVRDKTCPVDAGGTIGERVRVTIGGVAGTFAVDPRIGTTLVSRVFAAKAALESDPKQLAIGWVRHTTATGWLPVGQPQLGEPIRLDKVAAGAASAARVDALVIDELPETGVDGVLGLSFLWHYAFERTPAGFSLRPLDDKPL